MPILRSVYAPAAACIWSVYAPSPDTFPAPFRSGNVPVAMTTFTPNCRGAAVLAAAVFAAPAADPEGRVAALRVPRGAELTRK